MSVPWWCFYSLPFSLSSIPIDFFFFSVLHLYLIVFPPVGSTLVGGGSGGDVGTAALFPLLVTLDKYVPVEMNPALSSRPLLPFLSK